MITQTVTLPQWDIELEWPQDYGMPDPRLGVTGCVGDQNRLWWGRIPPELFWNQWQQILSHTQDNLRHLLKGDLDSEAQVALGNRLDMCRRMIQESVSWPCTATVMPRGWINWNNGQSRMFALALTRPNPWQEIPVLLLTTQPDQHTMYLLDPVPVTTDKQLESLLNLGNDRAYIKFSKRTIGKHHETALQIDRVGRSALFATLLPPHQRVQDLVSWYQNSQGKPRLCIYSNSEEQVLPHQEIWQCKWMGSGDVSMQDVLGQLKTPADHALIVTGNRQVDVWDLIWWMDPGTHIWQTQDGSVTVVRGCELKTFMRIGVR